jgi:CBS domain-containing protein
VDVELREVRDFLAEFPPYNALPERVLDGLPARLNVRYFRRGTTIIGAGAPNNSLFILRSGAVDILRPGGELVERADPGTTFGTSSVVSRQPSGYRIVAIEDSLVLVMPGDVFRQLLTARPEVADYFGTGNPDGLKRAVADLEGGQSGRIILKTRVADLLRSEPITAPPDLTIQAAARIMAERRVSALLIVDDGRLAGIMTDRDLRSKVVAAGLDPGAPVTAIMTADPLTIRSSALAFEAMLEMLGRNVHHLPVVDDGHLVGLVSSGDLMRLETANPVFLVGDIAKQPTAERLAAVTARVPRLVAQLVDQDASADEIHRLVTAVSDAATRQLLHLAEAELGPPPVPYEWLVLGSQARYEHGLGSDQDHVLLLDDAVLPEHDTYFAALAEAVASGLELCGYPRCPGEVMATNPRWRRSLASWRAEFRRWLAEPGSNEVLHAQIFFDLRSVHGGSVRAETLREGVLHQAPGSQRFLGHLAAQAVERQPPIGFFRGFVLEREGEHRATLDLKSGVHTIIELTRVHALAHGVPAVNTIERLRALGVLGALSAESENDLVAAFELVTYLRLRHQAAQVKAGLEPDNHLSPDTLSALERKHLRDAFGIIRRMQQALGYAYQTHLMS